jgi:hypothetical protein
VERCRAMAMRQHVPKSTLRQLQHSDWDRLWLQGLIWARREAARYAGLGLARMEREILQTAIEKTFSGERLWKPDVCDLPHHLRMTIRSLYSNEVRKLSARQAHAQLERVRPADPEEAARAQERLDDLRDVLWRLKAADPQLAAFFLEASKRLLQGCDTEGEVAAAMGLSPSQFSKRKARVAAIVAAGRQSLPTVQETRK